MIVAPPISTALVRDSSPVMRSFIQFLSLILTKFVFDITALVFPSDIVSKINMNSNRDGVDIICRTSHGWPIPIAPSQASGRRQCRQVTCAGEVDGGNHDDWKNSPRKFRRRGPHSEDESDDHDTIDMEMAQETAMDLSVAKAVKQLLDEGAKEPQPSPTEVFDEIYQVP